MPYEDLLSGLIELRVLYHAAEEEIFGLGMLEELHRHGYRVSPGTLYRLLHRLMYGGYLTVRDVSLGRTRRRFYRATPKRRRALASVRHHITELTVELDDDDKPAGRRAQQTQIQSRRRTGRKDGRDRATHA
jgi:DNA-binding PadR family transcriptional regulator